ncbi:MAG TPA: ACT domain-containing protein [Thermoleophilaceae bacterium]|jgi:glycine cleavage system transcriptional repressor
MRRLALTAIGHDRPGIVAAVSRVLLAHRANVEDSQMTILRGHFTMMLVVALADDADVNTLRDDLDDVREELALEAILLSPLEEVDPGGEPVPTHMVTLYGADHPGIVHAATSVLAERGVDITDLTTKLVNEAGGAPPLYALMMEIAPPSEAPEDELEDALRRVAEDQGVEVSLRRLESEAL